ncbi:MAG TPA: helix-turn-helix domain-containing protein [Allosphingosinicella sp.]|jgi:transcriptional regulator with XRE-family HTH domain
MNQSALNWRGLVEEAVRRRKAENLTQAGLASIAGVSRATVLLFERGETNLQLGKVFDILGALGLLEGVGPIDGQDSFVQAAQHRWQDLVSALPEGDPARLPLGHVSYDYVIEDVEAGPAGDLLEQLRSVEGHTGWPPFWVPEKEGLRPYTRGGLVECWLGARRDRVFADAAHSDFWRVSNEGRAFLRRGYQEDGPDNLQPGAVFDITLPIWRAAEVILHAAALAHRLAAPDSTALHIRAGFTGLEGRELASWAKPLLRGVVEPGRRARATAATVGVSLTVREALEALEGPLTRFLVPLYERFDGYRLTESLVAQELAELLAARRR